MITFTVCELRWAFDFTCLYFLITVLDSSRSLTTRLELHVLFDVIRLCPILEFQYDDCCVSQSRGFLPIARA